MPIFIAKDFDGFTIDIVLAKSYELAQVYWQGKGIVSHSIERKCESHLDNHSTGVLPILETHKKYLSETGLSSRDYIVVSRR